MDQSGWKLLWGQDSLLKVSKPEQARTVQLYNVMDDPEERWDRVDQEVEMVEMLKQRILKHKNTSYVEADWPKSEKIVSFLQFERPIASIQIICFSGTKKGWPDKFGGIFSSGWC